MKTNKGQIRLQKAWKKAKDSVAQYTLLTTKVAIALSHKSHSAAFLEILYFVKDNRNYYLMSKQIDRSCQAKRKT